MITRREQSPRGNPRWPSCVLLVALLGTLLGSVLIVPRLAAQKSHRDDSYALIFGTVWGPDDRPVYGIKVKIRRARDKKPKWELYSDHNGEFAQRVPAGEADYVLSADLKGVKTSDGQQLHTQEVTVHIYNDEREDTGVHLTR